MTLITVGNSDGSRRCDARCYGATSRDCDCVCGGMNHGKGLQVATERTREHAKSILEDWKKNAPTEECRIHLETIQNELFAGGVA